MEMVDDRRPAAPSGTCTVSRAADPANTPAVPESGDQSRRHRLAGVREAGPDPLRGFARAFGFQTALRRGLMAVARHRRRRAMRDRAPWTTVAIHRRGVSGLRRGRRAAPGRASGTPRVRCPKPSAAWRSIWWTPAARRCGWSPACTICRHFPASSRTRSTSGHDLQRANADPTPPAGARAGAATGPPGASVDQVSTDAELVSGQPRHDRQ